MRFDYSRYQIDVSRTVPKGVAYRPEVRIRVVGPRASGAVDALVDTGSDETVFPLSLSEYIGAELDNDSSEEVTGVGGHAVRLIPGQVTLRLEQGKRCYEWTVTVGFMETDQPSGEIALLGYAGFLEFFHAAFNSENHVLELTPNERFPRS